MSVKDGCHRSGGVCQESVKEDQRKLGPLAMHMDSQGHSDHFNHVLRSSPCHTDISDVLRLISSVCSDCISSVYAVLSVQALAARLVDPVVLCCPLVGKR